MGNQALKKSIVLFLGLVFLFFAQLGNAQMPQNVPAQALSNDAIQEMQQKDPQAAQAFSSAIQKGDFESAKKVYGDFKKTTSKDKETKEMDFKTSEELNRAIQKGDYATAQKILQEYLKSKRTKKETRDISAEAENEEPSLIENILSTDLPPEIPKPLHQFGYDLFNKTISAFTPSAALPVGPDYVIGPGDQFTLTIWGTTEGIYSFIVSKEGNITLPKVGVVPVAGIRFGDLDKTLKRHLSKYYSDFNLSVAMGSLKTITVYVVGEVTNPGSYSVNSLTTVYGALFTAGGPTKQGTLRAIQVLRSGKIIKTIDLYDFLLRGDRNQDIKLQNDDTVFVPLIGPVTGVAGSVYRPAIYELKGGETLGDVIQTAGGIMPVALSSRLQLYRFSDHQKKVILDINMDTARPVTAKQVGELQGKVQNMDLASILPIYDKIWETVNLNGSVQHSGDFQWRPDLRLKEIIQEGQLTPTSDLSRAEIIRLNKDFMDRTIIPVNLSALLAGDESQNILLQPKDQIRVYSTYREIEKVAIKGEVVKPGEFEVFKGERLSDLMRRVGGFTHEAYPYGMIFKRKNIRNTQSKNLQQFITRLQTQVIQQAAGGAATALTPEEAAFSKTEYTMNESLINNLKAMQEQFEGRIAVNITENIDQWAGTRDDLLLQDGDAIDIPKRPQEVLVVGEVYSPGAQIFVPDMTVRDYIDRTGNFTKYADKNYIYVVKANGFAFGAESSDVGNIEKMKLNAGDTIFVPQKIERYAFMRWLTNIIDILFKTAVTAATVHVLFP